MYGFLDLLEVDRLGDTLIGLLWAFAVVAEVGEFAVFTRVFGISARRRCSCVRASPRSFAGSPFRSIWPAGLGVPGFFAVQGCMPLDRLLLIGVQKQIAETVAEERTGAAQGGPSSPRHLHGHGDVALRAALRTAWGQRASSPWSASPRSGLVLIWLSAASAPERRLGR